MKVKEIAKVTLFGTPFIVQSEDDLVIEGSASDFLGCEEEVKEIFISNFEELVINI